MRDLLPLAGALVVGVVLGAIFFGGLWWTIVRGVSSSQPALWFLGSKLLRTAVALGGFYLAGGAHWERWLLCLLGFVFGRLLISRLTHPQSQDRFRPAPEAGNAP